METFKRILAFLFGGAILGMVLAVVIARGVLPWDNTPAMGQALCNCSEVTLHTIDRLIKWQLVGLLAGGVAGAILGAVMLRSRKPVDTTPPSTPV
ncbi:MAG: hypothetical protein M3Y59_19990 [Myxococcota bacterium]|nr:hypothetical protein [Myxococcota bacterium]